MDARRVVSVQPNRRHLRPMRGISWKSMPIGCRPTVRVAAYRLLMPSIHMRLTRKIRRVGNSLTIVIPSQLAQMVGLKAGDSLEIEYLGDSLRLKKSKG